MAATESITFLNSQPGLFRIFPLGELGTPQRAAPYIYHNVQSILGYHPAKLKIYQTMIDSCLYRGSDPSFPINMNIVNMLNARYFLVPGKLPPGMFELAKADEAANIFVYTNPNALPRAWFVDSVTVAGSDPEVFALLNSAGFNPARMAVLEKQLPAPVAPAPGATAEIGSYASRKIAIRTSTPARALLVLSEIYYPAGWDAYIDGEKTEIYRTNSILRSVVVPAGSHTVEFRFDPPMYSLGWNLTTAAWILCGMCVLGGGGVEWMKRKKKAKPGME